MLRLVTSCWFLMRHARPLMHQTVGLWSAPRTQLVWCVSSCCLTLFCDCCLTCYWDVVRADDEVEILDSPKKDKQQHQHQEQEQPLVTAADGDVTMIDADTDAEQQEQQQPDGAPADRASSPGAAADAAAAAAPGSWQLPFKLNGSEQLTQQQLLDVLPEFQVVNAYVCQECSAHLQEATAGHQGLKQQLEGQRQVLSKLLASTVTEALEQGVTYYLVPK